MERLNHLPGLLGTPDKKTAMFNNYIGNAVLKLNQTGRISCPGDTVCQNQVGSAKLFFILFIDPEGSPCPTVYIVFLIPRHLQVEGPDNTQTIFIFNLVPLKC